MMGDGIRTMIRAAKQSGHADAEILVVLRIMTVAILKSENDSGLTQKGNAFEFDGYPVSIEQRGPMVRTQRPPRLN